MQRQPIAKQLSDALGGTWKSVRDEGNWGWYWVSNAGRTVRPYSESILGWDGYSDTEFATVYIDNEGRKVGTKFGGQPIFFWERVPELTTR